MYLALIAHNNKKELMIQFCLAYAGVLVHHDLCATRTTGHLITEATNLPVHLFLSCQHGGVQQIGTRIAYNEIDMVLFFNDPNDNSLDEEVLYISRLCDQNNIPYATNIATAEMLILSMERGNLDWRNIANPKNNVPYIQTKSKSLN